MSKSAQNLASKSNMLSKSKSVILGSKANLRSRSRRKLQSKPALVEVNPITPNDSTDPSYTDLVLPYRVICRHRYHKSGVLQRIQFIKEIKAHEILQVKALDGERIHRIFCTTTLSELKPEDIIKPTVAQQMMIEDILKTVLKL